MKRFIRIIEIINTPRVVFMIPFIGFTIYFLFTRDDFSLPNIMATLVVATIPSYFVALVLTAIFSTIEYMYHPI